MEKAIWRVTGEGGLLVLVLSVFFCSEHVTGLLGIGYAIVLALWGAYITGQRFSARHQ